MLTHRFSLFALLSLLPACFNGSGHLETRSFALDGFDAVEAERDIVVDVTRGDTFAVSVTADDNLWTELDVRREGHTLVLALSDAHPIYSGVTVHATVTMPALARLDLSGGTHATLRGFDATVPALALHGSGGSRVEGSVNAQDLTVELSGGSEAVLGGSADTLSVDASGGSVSDLLGVHAGAADVALSGSSRGAVTALHRLDYHLSGGSHLDYAGEPELGQQDSSGGSGVTRR